MLSNNIKGNLDILMISEAKLHLTFPSNNFTIERNATLVRFERNGREEEFFYTYERISQLDC